MSRKLLELARLAEKTVTIAGEELRIREPNGLQMMEYRAQRSTDLAKAVAGLIHGCVIDEAGSQVYTPEEALQLAQGPAEVFTPLVLALTGFDSGAEKKSSPPTSSSATA